ncbi:MAG: hypothetical protein CM15mP12_6810 [Gammaproteobacteria bacterium]|nr:MAG: hypothetical protein CM15mP12_6810 [Gammaproteobacteria bacterium]
MDPEKRGLEGLIQSMDKNPITPMRVFLGPMFGKKLTTEEEIFRISKELLTKYGSYSMKF